MRDLALYIHWPFCAKKCPYCDFNSHVRDRVDVASYARAYDSELTYYRHMTGPRRVTSIFFGGGTPSLMPPDLAGQIIQKANDLWGIEKDAEITLEANPGSSETEKFKAFKANGINRLSIGIQSFYDDALRFLGRIHTAQEGQAAIAAAQKVFDRFSFDLIYARPNQTEKEWEQELRMAIGMSSGHLSLYQLTIEEKTAFYGAYQRGEWSLPDEDAAAALYQQTDDMMRDAGMPAYEISNYARAGQESRHNLTYWQYKDYVGVGPGAHGRWTYQGQKWASVAEKGPEKWVSRVLVDEGAGHGSAPFTLVSSDVRAGEAVMMGLRLTSGINPSCIADDSGILLSDLLNMDRVSELVSSGDLVWLTPETLAPTMTGRLRLNRVIHYILKV
jgi:putative oxygen-independent coproporphyrinogen III oxidase